MSTQPEALRLADWLLNNVQHLNHAEAAAELRRLHQSEREGWRHADELEQERKRLHEVNQELLEAMHTARDHIDMTALEISHCKDAERIRAAIAKAQEQK